VIQNRLIRALEASANLHSIKSRTHWLVNMKSTSATRPPGFKTLATSRIISLRSGPVCISCRTKFETTMSNDSSGNGNLRASPATTSTRSATPSRAALSRTRFGELPVKALGSHISTPTALPVVKRRAEPTSNSPSPQPMSRTVSLPPQRIDSRTSSDAEFS